MLTLLVGVASLKENLIHQKPQAPESVLEQVWTILNAAHEDKELYTEFDRWEAASDEDEVQIETMLFV
jgi:hypothetical protein